MSGNFVGATFRPFFFTFQMLKMRIWRGNIVSCSLFLFFIFFTFEFLAIGYSVSRTPHTVYRSFWNFVSLLFMVRTCKCACGLNTIITSLCKTFSMCTPTTGVIQYLPVKKRKWVWSGNTTITNCRHTPCIVRKSDTTITRHQEDNQSKATSSLFTIKTIAKLEWT